MSAALAIVRSVRIMLAVGFWMLVVTVAALGVLARAAPLANHELLAVRSGSMSPTIGVGDMVAVDTDADEPAAGDVIAFQLPGGSQIVHRVVGSVDDACGVCMTTRGDANEAADPSPVAPDQVVGTVSWRLPLAGYLLGMLGMASGLVSIGCLAGALACGTMLAEDLEDELIAAVHSAKSARVSGIVRTGPRR